MALLLEDNTRRLKNKMETKPDIFEGHSKIRWILHKVLAIGSTVYGITYFKDIYSDGSFRVPEDNQYNLLLWPKLFFV